MAWIEVATQYEKVAVYADGNQRHLTACLTPLYYEAAKGSGLYTLPVDMSPVARLGQREAKSAGYEFTFVPDNGLLVYGGLKNKQALQKQLVNFGYLDAADTFVSWDGAPNWRGEITYTDGKITVGPFSDPRELRAETITKWADVWSGCSLTLRADGRKLKDELLISEVARERVTTQFPAGWDGERSIVALLYYMGASIPAFYVEGSSKSADAGFAYSDKEIEFRTAQNESLGALSAYDFAYCGITEKKVHGDDPQIIRLQKRIFKGSDGYYLAVGMPYAEWVKAKAGAILLDPTVNAQVGTGNDDGDMKGITAGSNRSVTTGSTMDLSHALLKAGYHPPSSDDWTTACRFTSIAIAQAATINSATFTLYGSDNFTSSNTIIYHVSAQAADNAGALSSSSGDFNTSVRTRTTANDGPWDVQAQLLDTAKTRTVTTIIQEVINRAGWSSGNAIVILIDTESTSNDYQEWRSYNGSSSLAPKLDIDYTAGGTTYPQSLSGSVTPTGTLTKQPRKVFAGGVTPTGTLAKRANKVLAGGVTPSGTLAAIRTALLSLTGSVTPTGTLTKQANKVLSGGVIPSGALVKQVNKVLAGLLTPAGTLAAIKTALLSLSGNLTPSGALTRQTNKTLAGSVAPTGTLIRQIGKILSGALTPAGAISKRVAKTLAGSLFPSGILQALQGSITPAIPTTSTIYDAVYYGSVIFDVAYWTSTISDKPYWDSE